MDQRLIHSEVSAEIMERHLLNSGIKFTTLLIFICPLIFMSTISVPKQFWMFSLVSVASIASWKSFSNISVPSSTHELSLPRWLETCISWNMITMTKNILISAKLTKTTTTMIGYLRKIYPRYIWSFFISVSNVVKLGHNRRLISQRCSKWVLKS